MHYNLLIKSFKLYISSAVRKIWVFGFSSGLCLLLSGNTLNFWLANSGIDIKTLGLFSLVGMPYALKFAWAPLIDRFRIPLLHKLIGHRKSWIVISQILITLLLIKLAAMDPTQDLFEVAILSFLIALCSVSQDIALDAFRVKIMESEEKGPLTAMYIFGYRMGMLVSGGGAIYMSSFISWNQVYMVMSLLVTLNMLMILCSFEDITKHDVDLAEAKEPTENIQAWLNEVFIKPFLSITTIKQLVIILVFIILYKLPDNMISLVANKYLLSLNFNAKEIAAAAKFFGVIATILGTFISGMFIKYISLRKSLLIFGIVHLLSHFLYIIQALIGHNLLFLYFLVGIENITGGMAMAAYIAFITNLCFGKYAGTQYSLFSSMMGISRVLLPTFSGFIVAETNWIIFFIITIIMGLPGIILINYIQDLVKVTDKA